MALTLSGERVIPEEYIKNKNSFLIYLFHTATYQFSIPYVEGKDVLDLGCGTGYGSCLLAPHCSAITGVDIAPDAIGYAKTRFSAKNLEFRTIEDVTRTPLPFSDQTFDVVVSFQVIEHIRNTERYLQEVQRVLRSGGLFVLATPDRTTRLMPFQKPWNRFHVREYSSQSLSSVLSRHFTAIEILNMSGLREVLEAELVRTSRLKFLSLPFTLPFLPDWIRTRLLDMLAPIADVFSISSRRVPFVPLIDESAISIGKDLAPSINLIAIARK